MTRARQPLTPALLSKFGKLGATLAGGPAPAPPPAQLSTHELKERGWTAAMITKLLPAPDDTRANQLEVGPTRKRLTDPVKLYNLARVERAEATEAFLAARAKALRNQQAAAKGTATRAQRVQAYVDGYVPQLLGAPAPLSGLDLWTYHRGELHAYERAHAAQLAQLPTTDQLRAGEQVFTKHRLAFVARFGAHY